MNGSVSWHSIEILRSFAPCSFSRNFEAKFVWLYRESLMKFSLAEQHDNAVIGDEWVAMFRGGSLMADIYVEEKKRSLLSCARVERSVIVSCGALCGKISMRRTDLPRVTGYRCSILQLSFSNSRWKHAPFTFPTLATFRVLKTARLFLLHARKKSLNGTVFAGGLFTNTRDNILLSLNSSSVHSSRLKYSRIDCVYLGNMNLSRAHLEQLNLSRNIEFFQSGA